MGLYEDSKLVRLGKGKPYLHDNVLHQFASYNTIFTLSGISEKEMRAQQYLTNPVHEIIARTGGIGGNANVLTRQFAEAETGDASGAERSAAIARYKDKYSGSISILERAHDLFIENVNMISTASPGSERGLGNFTKIEFEIHEPYGVTFVEKVHAATGINGYKDYQDAPLLLTIEFKGLDENGREVKTKPVIRKIPIGIARVEFDVNEGGARYSIIAVPYPELGYDDRYKYPRCDVPVAADKPLDWARDVESVLATQMEKEIEEKKREIPDIYKFEIDKAVLDFADQYATNETNATVVGTPENILGTEDPLSDAGTTLKTVIKKVQGTAGDTTSLIKFFEDAIRQSTGYKKLAESFWTTYLTSIGVDPSKLVTDEAKLKYMEGNEFQQKLIQNQYVDWFKIKTTVYTDIERFDNITKMHPKTIIYRAVPCKVHVLRMVTAGISIAGIDWGRQVHKEYNYIYTGANVDVQNLRINYKTAYYLRNVRGDDKSFAEDGLFSWAKKAAKNVFGREKYPEPIKPLRSYPSNIKGRNTLQDGDTSGNQRSQEFYDYLTNPEADMIKIELEILGDPAFICQDSFLNVKPDGTVLDTFRTTFSREYESFNSDSFQPIINVVYRIPDDLDDNKGLMFSDGGKTRDEDLFFNGLYQVNKIESRFDNGQFLQTLFCSRFNNQQGLGKNPLVSDVISDSNKLIQTKIKVEDLEAKARTAKGILEAVKLKDIQDIAESLNE